MVDLNPLPPTWLATFDTEVPEGIKALIEHGAIFVINHSGGKDSQAMFHFIRRHVPDEQIRVVHALLPEVEWEGVEEHIRNTILGHDLYTCQARRTLLQMVEDRGKFPSPAMRWCTSDLKRGCIERTIRRMGIKLIVNCMGMRAEESAKRAKLVTLKQSDRNSKAGRHWYDWLPIHDWSVDQVFESIRMVGQEPHWAYSKGSSRLSCCFCIMSSKADLTIAAQLNPVLYKRYVDLEASTGHVMIMPTKKRGRLGLEEITGIKAG